MTFPFTIIPARFPVVNSKSGIFAADTIVFWALSAEFCAQISILLLGICFHLCASGGIRFRQAVLLFNGPNDAAFL